MIPPSLAAAPLRRCTRGRNSVRPHCRSSTFAISECRPPSTLAVARCAPRLRPARVDVLGAALRRSLRRRADVDPPECCAKAPQHVLFACMPPLADDPAAAAHQIPHGSPARAENRRIDHVFDGLLGERRIVAIEHDKIRTHPRRNHARRSRQGLRTAFGSRAPQRLTDRCLRSIGEHIATAHAQPLRPLELPHFRERVDQRVRVACRGRIARPPARMLRRERCRRRGRPRWTAQGRRPRRSPRGRRLRGRSCASRGRRTSARRRSPASAAIRSAACRSTRSNRRLRASARQRGCGSAHRAPRAARSSRALPA